MKWTKDKNSQPRNRTNVFKLKILKQSAIPETKIPWMGSIGKAKTTEERACKVKDQVGIHIIIIAIDAGKACGQI